MSVMIDMLILSINTYTVHVLVELLSFIIKEMSFIHAFFIKVLVEVMVGRQRKTD